VKVTIITVCYNAEQTIADCIRSVASQDYFDIEHLIVDGASTDGTLKRIRESGFDTSHLVSEPDKGIYDAMNKGLRKASGQVIGILNADDFYADPQVISDVVKTFQSEDCMCTYGDLEYVSFHQPEKVVRKWHSGPYQRENFRWGWMPPHPSFFVKAELYERLGGFRLDLGTAADYELMLRFLYVNRLKTSYLSRVLVKMRAGGASNQTLSRRLEANRYDRKAWKVNNLKPNLLTLWLKPIRKISQFFT
jgi:glycosyltransferase involved in cell wall biosynthesis